MIQYIVIGIILALLLWLLFRTEGRAVYLIEHVCWQPPAEAQIPHKRFLDLARQSGRFTEQSLNFQWYMLTRNGLGDETYLPPRLFEPGQSISAKQEEMLTAVFGAMDALFNEYESLDIRHKLDILIICCPSFTTQPSICAHAVNRYKLKPSIRCYNLTGMGTASGILGIDLAQDLLQIRPNSHCVVVSTDNCTANMYWGNTRDQLVANTLWRWGASAVLLSNIKSEKKVARYRLIKTIRIHLGSDDACFDLIKMEDDREGNPGMRISKYLRKEMRKGIRMNINTLLPYLLSISDIVRIAYNSFMQHQFPKKKRRTTINFKKYVKHFLVHGGGVKLINDIKINLQLTDEDVEPSFATLYRYGLLSASSPWYQLAYLERKRSLQKGDLVFQLSYGSGFKSASATWQVLNTDNNHPGDVWPEMLQDSSFRYRYVAGEAGQFPKPPQEFITKYKHENEEIGDDTSSFSSYNDDTIGRVEGNFSDSSSPSKGIIESSDSIRSNSRTSQGSIRYIPAMRMTLMEGSVMTAEREVWRNTLKQQKQQQSQKGKGSKSNIEIDSEQQADLLLNEEKNENDKQIDIKDEKDQIQNQIEQNHNHAEPRNVQRNVVKVKRNGQ